MTTDTALLTVEQVAERLAMSLNGTRNLIYRGQLPSVKIGKNVRVAEADLAAFIAASPSAARTAS